MDTISAIVIRLVVVLNLLKLATSCDGRDGPLLLSSYLDRGEIEIAQMLSKVNRKCLKDFVPDSFAGYITTDKIQGHHLFFWFFPCPQNADAPILLWLNGGPTVPSMVGLFWENGPMQFEIKGDKVSYSKRKYSWTESFSMLYVDNPVGVGYSYSDNEDLVYDVTQKRYTDHLTSFVSQFFILFPEFKRHDFYIGGQSYAGKYVSALGYDLHRKIQDGSSDVNLSGIYLGAPFFDPETESLAHYDYLYALGTISHKQRQDGRQNVTALFAKARESSQGLKTSNLTGVVFRYSYIKDFDNYVTGETIPYDKIAELMSSPSIRKAVHVGQRPFEVSDEKLYNAFVHDWIVSTKNEIAELMSNYKFLLYNGDYDVVVNSAMIEAALLTTPWDHQEDYNNSKREPWRDRHDTIGMYSLTDRFCRVVVIGAGHQVPHDMPAISLLMMQQFVKDGCVSDATVNDSLILSSYSASCNYLHSSFISLFLVIFVFFV